MGRIQTAGFAIIGAALVLAAAWIASANGASAGAGPTVAVDSATIAVGDTGTVAVEALNMAAPGLGAWSLNVVYDPSMLEQEGCTAQNGSVCNPAFGADTVRISGATATGLEGDTVLATIGFRCLAVGSSALTLTIDTLADGTPGDPQDIDAAVSNGSVNCIVAPTPTEPPTPPPGGGGGNGFPAAGGWYIGSVPSGPENGTIKLRIQDNGQGIEEIDVVNLVTVCGAFTQELRYRPALDIQEPGFHLDLGTLSEGAAFLTMDGFFAEDGTIPITLEVHTDNVDFPPNASPCISDNEVFRLVLFRTTTPPPPPPAGGGTTGGGTTGGGRLPNAGTGFTLDPQSPMTWIVAAMAGAGLAWLSAGVAGAGLAAANGSAGEQRQRRVRGFMPRMQPVRRDAQPAQPQPTVDRSAHALRHETPVAQRPRAPRTVPKIGAPPVSEFRAPRRPDRR